MGVVDAIQWEAYYDGFPLGARCDLDAYEQFQACWRSGDASVWNSWRQKHRDVTLHGLCVIGQRIPGIDLENCHLEGSTFQQCAFDRDVNLENAYLTGAYFTDCSLHGVNMHHAYLQGVDFTACDLTDVSLSEANLEGATISKSVMDGVNMQFAVFNGLSKLDPSQWNLRTDATGTNVATARSYPQVRQSLDYNVRRLQWEKWYGKHPISAVPVRLFWMLSDYGNSFGRIVAVFVTSVLAYSLVYLFCGILDNNGGLIDGLCKISSRGNGTSEKEVLPSVILPVRAVYFSVVTMTTLGFGDMHARADSIWGHIVVTTQVCIGYIMLAALVTRLAVLAVSTNGPSG